MNQESLIPILKRCALFADVPSADLESVKTPIAVETYHSGDTVLEQGTEGRGLCILLDGVARVRMNNSKGGATDLAYLAAGDAFGEISLFTGNQCMADVVTRTDAHVLCIPKSAISELISKSPAFAEKILQALATRIKDTDKLLADISFNNLEGRIAAKLFHLADKFGVEIEEGLRIMLPLTHAELAELAGTSRETVTKILGTFRKEGSITIEDKEITIINQKKLKKWMEG